MSFIFNPETASETEHSQLRGLPVPLSDLNAPYAMPSITDMDAAGTDLTDGATVVWDSTNGYVPSAQIDPSVDADTVDGKHASQLGKSTSEVRKDTMIHNAGFAPGFSG